MNDVLNYAWEITGPGGTTTLNGPSVNFAPTIAGTYDVQLIVSDGDGGQAPVVQGVIDVTARDPEITIAADLDTKISVNAQFELNGSFVDVIDSDAHTVRVDWGDGTPEELVAVDQTQNTFSANHVYPLAGVFDVVVTVTDNDDGGSASDSITAMVSGVALHDGILQVVGTGADDRILVSRSFRFFSVSTNLRGFRNVRFDDDLVTKIEVFACDGDDRVNVSFLITLPTTILGGTGNDRLFGGSGKDTIRGGAGEDKIGGGLGDDRLFGGGGSDELDGGFGDDKLRGGNGGDKLECGFGNDQLDGGRGEDELDGGHGDDLLHRR